MEELTVGHVEEDVEKVNENIDIEADEVPPDRKLHFGCCKIECLCNRYAMRGERDGPGDGKESIPKGVIESAEKFAEHWFRANSHVGLALVPDSIEIIIYRKVMVIFASLLLNMGMPEHKVKATFSLDHVETVKEKTLAHISNFFMEYMSQNPDRRIAYFPDRYEQWLHSKVSVLVLSLLNSIGFAFDGFELLVDYALNSDFDIRDTSDIDLATVFGEHKGEDGVQSVADQVVHDCLNFYTHMLLSSCSLNMFGLEVFVRDRAKQIETNSKAISADAE